MRTSIWTVGHSTRSADEFAQILLAHQIDALVDVRSFPGSRRYPHFNQPELSQSLQQLGIQYVHSPALGGRRRPTLHSKNTAWKNASFRAYADHMESAEFEKGIEELLELNEINRTAIMCAEALWWRCHRSLISDYLKARGIDVIHILDDKHTEAHPYTSAARIVGDSCLMRVCSPSRSRRLEYNRLCPKSVSGLSTLSQAEARALVRALVLPGFRS